VLGCGTSHGVPMIGCECRVCLSDNPKNNRTRSALYLKGDGCSTLIDAPPELRLQLCREGIAFADQVILTHAHADHVMGLDDLRRFNDVTGRPLPIYAQEPVLEAVRRIVPYALQAPDKVGGGVPSFELYEAPAMLDPEIELFEVMHGTLAVLGVKVRGFAYLTDVSEIPSVVKERLMNLETLIVDATRIAPHSTHYHLEKALQVIEELGPRLAYLTHLAHDYDYDEWAGRLPAGVALSYDGLQIEVA